MAQVANPYNRRYRASSVKRVVIAHLVVIGLALLIPLVSGLFKPKPPETIAINLAVGAPPTEAPDPQPTPPEVTPQPPDPPPREPDPPPPPREPEPRPRNPVIKQNGRRVTIDRQRPKPNVPNVDDALRDLTEVRPDQLSTGPVTDESAEYAKIYQAMMAGWIRPVRDETGKVVAQLTIRLGAGGAIVGSQLSRPSGNAQMDASVRAVPARVGRIPGLSSEFIRKHPSITIDYVHDAL